MTTMPAIGFAGPGVTDGLLTKMEEPGCPRRDIAALAGVLARTGTT
jgi:hypothetical protein